MACRGTSDPDRIISSASSFIPNSPSVFASQATQLTGEPNAAAPAPVAITSPFFSCTIPQVTRSTLSGLTWLSPSKNRPHDALSAMVSCILIFQSLILESTISKHGMTHSVARNTSALVIPGPSRSRFRIKAISPSALGCISSLLIGISAPLLYIILSVK